MVGDAEYQRPPAGLDHRYRSVSTERLTSDNSDGSTGRSGTTAADASCEARGHQQQSDNDYNRKDQSEEDDGQRCIAHAVTAAAVPRAGSRSLR